MIPSTDSLRAQNIEIARPHSPDGWFRRVVLLLLWIQLCVILFTIPAGRVAFDLLGQRLSFGGSAHKLCTAFLLTWLVLWLVSGSQRVRGGFFLAPFLALAIAALFSGGSSGYWYDSLKEALKLGLCAGFYWALLNLPESERRKRSVAVCFIAGNLYLGLVVLFELIVGRQYRAEGTFGHPNLLAGYALLGLPMLLLIARLCRDWRTHLAVYGVALLLFVSILFTFSRGAYLGLAVSMLLMWRLGGRRALVHVVPFVLAALLVAPFFVGPAMERFREAMLDLSAPRPESRLVIWGQALKYTVRDLPSSGWGAGNAFKDRLYYLQSLRNDRAPYPPINHAHNLLLHVWLSLGVPGLLAVTWMAVRFVRFVPPRDPAGTWGRHGEHAYFFGSMAGFVSFACFDTLLFSKNVTPALALFLGMLERLRTEPDGPASTVEPLEPVGSSVFVRRVRSLRILHLFGNYRYTGPAGMVITICSTLLDRGHHVIFACPQGPPRWRISSRGLVIRPRHDEERTTVRSVASEHGLPLDERLRLNRHLNLFDNVADIHALRQGMREGRWDIIHAHFPHELLLAVQASKPLVNRPALVASIYKDQPPPTNPFSQHLLYRVSGLLCVSSGTREGMVRAGLVKAENCRLLPGLVDTERFHPGLDVQPVRARLGIAAGAPLVGMISRFQPYRRHDLVIEAWGEVTRRVPDARLVLIGRGENESRLRHLVERRGLAKSVTFAGYRIDDYPHHVSVLDLLVYLRPGSDGTCRTVLEAMAAGRPVLVSPIGALRDLVREGVNGLFLREEIPRAVAEAIVYLLSSPGRLREMGRRGREMVEQRHTPDHVADLVEQFYASLIASRGIPEQRA